MASQNEQKHRFQTLDALRGIAALLVIQIHMPFLFAKYLPFPHAYLAVDFFFMLSGFVIAYAYGPRLEQGWATPSFLRVRLFRLYPLFLLSLPLGLLHLIVVSHKEHLPFLIRELPEVLLFGVLLLPLPTWVKTGGVTAFPINGVSWSLFLEGCANIGHALFLRQRSTTQMIVIVVFPNLLLIPVSMHHGGIEVGFEKGQLLIGLIRLMASYAYGVLLLRLWHQQKRAHFLYGVLSAGLLLVVLMTPLPKNYTWLMDLAAVFLIFPMVILCAANAALPRLLYVPLKFLGVLSYAIYILHPAIYVLFTGLWTLILHSKAADHAPWSGTVFVPFVVLVSYLAVRFWDFPIRRLLLSHRQPVTTEKPIVQQAVEL